MNSRGAGPSSHLQLRPGAGASGNGCHDGGRRRFRTLGCSRTPASVRGPASPLAAAVATVSAVKGLDSSSQKTCNHPAKKNAGASLVIALSLVTTDETARTIAVEVSDLQLVTKTKRSTHVTHVTPYGLKENSHCGSMRNYVHAYVRPRNTLPTPQ